MALKHEQQEKARASEHRSNQESGTVEMQGVLAMQPIDESNETFDVVSTRRDASGFSDGPDGASYGADRSITGASSRPQGTLPDSHSSEDLVRHSSSVEKPAMPYRPRTAMRRRRYQTFENPLSTWFCGGHLMTGGDSYFSMIFTLVIIFGLSGVWLGTTGAWLWQYGHEYGLVRGGGIAVVVVFMSVCLLRDV